MADLDQNTKHCSFWSHVVSTISKHHVKQSTSSHTQGAKLTEVLQEHEENFHKRPKRGN